MPWLTRKTTFNKAERLAKETVSRKAERIAARYIEGRYVATNYRLGDRYLNAWGCADARKITDRDERIAFIDGFNNVLPVVRCDERGRIIDLGVPKIFE